MRIVLNAVQQASCRSDTLPRRAGREAAGHAQQSCEIAAPHRGKRVGAVPSGLIRDRQERGTAMFHAPDLALENPKLRRVDEIVG